VEVRDRAPCAVVRLIYEMLDSMRKGGWTRHVHMPERALAELAIGRVIPRFGAKETVVVDAGSRFVAAAGLGSRPDTGTGNRARRPRRVEVRTVVASLPNMNDRVDWAETDAVPRRVKETSVLLSAHSWIYSVSRRLEFPAVSETWYGHG